jgi:hypothetical protein
VRCLGHVGVTVADLGWAATEGYGLAGGIGEYKGAWRMAYVRGKGSSSHGRAHQLSLATPALPRVARQRHGDLAE